MNDLMRELAPITEGAWAEIEAEAKATLKTTLAGRRVVDVDGPLGWTKSAIGLGRADPISGQALQDGVSAAMRRVQPLIELRAVFNLARAELDAIARGAADADLDAVTQAAQAIGLAEDRAIFHGYQAGGITGMHTAAADAALTINSDYRQYPDIVAQAVANLRKSGVAGPYAIALGPRCYTGLTQTTEAGYPVMQHVQRLLDGPVLWAPAVNGAAVVSLRGGDFTLSLGRDFSIGYSHHDGETVTLYIEESMTFQATAPEAAIPLVYADG